MIFLVKNMLRFSQTTAFITSNKNLALKYLVQSLIFLSIYHNN